MSRIYLSQKGFKPATVGMGKVLSRVIETVKEKDTIVFPAESEPYYLTETVVQNNKGLRWEGTGDTKLRVYHSGTGLQFTRNQGTYWTEIEGIILSNNKGDHDNFKQHGIESNVQIKMKNVEVHSFFGHGIYLWASIGGERPESNVAFSRLDSVLVGSCKGDGIYIQGGDASSINFYHVDVRDCVGIGFHDDSQYGCMFYGCMAHNNWKGNYRSMSPVSSSSFFGCYSERGENPDAFGGSAQVFGGTFSGDLLVFGSNAAGYFNGKIYKNYNEQLIKELIV